VAGVDRSPPREIRPRGEDSNTSSRKRDGYSRDFDQAPHVYTHQAVERRSAEHRGVVGVETPVHSSFPLLVSGLDVHRGHESSDLIGDRVAPRTTSSPAALDSPRLGS
jgi:hypothetical protein